MAGSHAYELTERFAVVKRDGDVVGKFDQHGGGTIYVGRNDDTLGETITVEESPDRSHIEVPLDVQEAWFTEP
jgi:hypothetical protein